MKKLSKNEKKAFIQCLIITLSCMLLVPMQAPGIVLGMTISTTCMSIIKLARRRDNDEI